MDEFLDSLRRLGAVLDAHSNLGSRDGAVENELSDRLLTSIMHGCIEPAPGNPWSISGLDLDEAMASITLAYLETANALMGVSLRDLNEAKKAIAAGNF